MNFLSTIDSCNFFRYYIIKVKIVGRMMEKTLLKMQFKERLCRTLLRVNWMIAIVAMMPVLSKIIIGLAAVGTALYLLILIAITILTLGLFLLDESFRLLFKIDLDGLQELSDQIVNAYRSALPVLAVLFLIVTGVILLVIIKNQDDTHKTRRIVSVSLAILLFLMSVLLYYIKLI